MCISCLNLGGGTMPFRFTIIYRLVKEMETLPCFLNWRQAVRQGETQDELSQHYLNPVSLRYGNWRV